MTFTPAQSTRLHGLTLLYLRTIRSHLDNHDCLRNFFRGMLVSGLADVLIGFTPSELATAASEIVWMSQKTADGVFWVAA